MTRLAQILFLDRTKAFEIDEHRLKVRNIKLDLNFQNHYQKSSQGQKKLKTKSKLNAIP